jgi:hypothetical protein
VLSSLQDSDPVIWHVPLEEAAEVELVPGGEYLAVLTSSGGLLLLSAETGRIVASWLDYRISDGEITEAKIRISTSSKGEILLLVLADHVP